MNTMYSKHDPCQSTQLSLPWEHHVMTKMREEKTHQHMEDHIHYMEAIWSQTMEAVIQPEAKQTESILDNIQLYDI